MKRTVFTLLALFGAVLSVFSQDAAAIVSASRNRIKAATVSTRIRMLTTARDGSTREQMLDQYSKDNASGESRAVIVFQRPPSVRGTRFLTLENKGRGNDQWIFLPALGKVRRISSSEGSDSFMGTDFSYDDIASASRDADLDTHSLAGEEAYNGIACYVIESRPKDGSYQYSRMVQWIGKESEINYKLELYNRRGALVKTVEMSGIKDVQGWPTVHVTKMTTLAGGTSTSLVTDIIKYDDPIPESVFTTGYLETGRAAR
ncbi:MAG: outer membrane lipoprotein-sorting protein [Treponema sp.]|jgi:outer membrane lipoprotein-sorting protein|nr:outer membrane lipoprotein-sorting protein [Treponema sp.]